MARQRNIVRRKTPNRAWGSVVDTQNAIAGPGTKVLLGSLSLSNPNIDETVLRTVGTIAVASDQTAGTEVQEGAVGLIVAGDRAILGGVASLPGPITDMNDDEWFVHIPFSFKQQFVSAIGIYPDFAHMLQFDFKSKRIVEDGNSLAVIVESSAASDGFTFSILLRILSMVRGTG